MAELKQRGNSVKARLDDMDQEVTAQEHGVIVDVRGRHADTWD